MLRAALRRSVDFVTRHNLITLVVMVLLTAVVLAGIPQIDTAALVTAFLASVLVLPSILLLWSRYSPEGVRTIGSVGEPATQD